MEEVVGEPIHMQGPSQLSWQWLRRCPPTYFHMGISHSGAGNMAKKERMQCLSSSQSLPAQERQPVGPSNSMGTWSVRGSAVS